MCCHLEEKPHILSIFHVPAMLDVTLNLLTGSTPEEYEGLSKRLLFGLSINFLSGTLPQSFGRNQQEMFHFGGAL